MRKNFQDLRFFSSFCQNDIFKKTIEIFQCIRGTFQNIVPPYKKVILQIIQLNEKELFPGRGRVGAPPPPNKKN